MLLQDKSFQVFGDGYTSNFLALVVGFMVANFLLYLIKESDDDNGGGDGGMMIPASIPT